MRKLLFLSTLLAAACAARADEPAADAPLEARHPAADECQLKFDFALPLEIRRAIDAAHGALKACCPVQTQADCPAECAQCATKCASKCSKQCTECASKCAECASKCSTQCTECASKCAECASKCAACCEAACKSQCCADSNNACAHCCAASDGQCAAHCAHCTACKTACDECNAKCQTACQCQTACHDQCQTACSDRCRTACDKGCACEAGCKCCSGPGRVVLMRFEAPWCGPCQAMARQVFEHPQFKQAIGQHCAVIRINIDDKPELARQFDIHSLPTCVIISPQGKVIEKVVGMQGGEALLARVRMAAGGHPGCAAAGCCPVTGAAGCSCKAATAGCAGGAPGCACTAATPPCTARGNASYCATGPCASNCPACTCGSSCQCAPGKTCNPACTCGGPRIGSRCTVATGSTTYAGVLRRITATWVVLESESGAVHWVPAHSVDCISVQAGHDAPLTDQVRDVPKADPFSQAIPPGCRVYSFAISNPEACRQLRAGDRVDVQFETSPHPTSLHGARVFAVSSSVGTGDSAPAVQLALLLTPQQCRQVEPISTASRVIRAFVVSASAGGPGHFGSNPQKPRSGLIWSFDETGDLLVDHKWTCPAGHEGCVACPPQSPSTEDVHVAPPALNTSPAQYLEEQWAKIPPPNPVYIPQPPRPQTHEAIAPQEEPAPAPQPYRRRARAHHDGQHRRQAAHRVDESRQFLVQAQLTETGQDEETKVISRPLLRTVAGQPARVEIDDQFKLEMTIAPSPRQDGLLEVKVVDGSDETLRSVASIRSGDGFKLQWSGPPHSKRWLECTVTEIQQKQPTRHAEYLPQPPLDPVPPQPLPAPQTSRPLHMQVYAVADLVRNGPDGKPDFGPLLQQIKSQVAPGSWSGDGGEGLIHPFGPNRSIVVRQTADAHAQLGKYLNRLRERNFSRTVRFESIVPGAQPQALDAPAAPPVAPPPLPPLPRPAPPAPPELLPPR